MRITSFLYRLLFDAKRQPKIRKQEELFHTDDFLRPNKINYRKCPKCSKEAKTNKDIVVVFGTRISNGKPSLQSWCKSCRNELNQKNK